MAPQAKTNAGCHKTSFLMKNTTEQVKLITKPNQFLTAFNSWVLPSMYRAKQASIMMLACFALYMEGNTHELNAVKNWLGLVINFTCSVVFFIKKLVLWQPALVLACGAIVGGYFA